MPRWPPDQQKSRNSSPKRQPRRWLNKSLLLRFLRLEVFTSGPQGLLPVPPPKKNRVKISRRNGIACCQAAFVRACKRAADAWNNDLN